MPENNYSIDELLAELRARRGQIESRIAKRENPEGEVPASVPQPPAEVPAPAAEEPVVPVIPETAPAPAAAEETLFPEEPVPAPEAEAPADPESVPEEEKEEEAAPAEQPAPEEKEENAPEQPENAPEPEKDGASLRNLRKQLTETFELPLRERKTEEFRIGQKEEAPEPQAFSLDEIADIKREQIEEHPLFTGAIHRTSNVMEEVTAEQPPVPKTPEEEEIGAEVRKASAFEKTGVLNIREAEDDNTFRTFFGDTVLVEHNDETRKKSEAPVPKPEPGDKAPVDDPEAVLSALNGGRQRAVLRTGLQLLIALGALLLNTALAESLSDGVFYGFNLAFCIATIALNAREFLKGIRGLADGSAGAFSLPAVSAVICLVQCLVSFLTGREPSPMAVAVTAFAVFFADLADCLNAVRNLSNYKRISVIPRKYATLPLEDEALSKALARELNVSYEQVLVKRRAGVIDGFTAYSSSDGAAFAPAYGLQKWFALAALALGALCAVLTHADLPGAADCLAMAFAIMTPFGAGLASALPIWKAQKKLDPKSAVLPGYPAAEALCDANCVVLEGRELFPRERVLLHGIKTFEKERVDKAILYAASVLINSCDTMSHMFMKVIQGKTEMLYDADSIVYEEGLGFSFWVDQSRILVGRREMLEAHEISVPSRDYENRYTKTSTRDAIYLAVSGKLYAMFVISYQPDDDMQYMLQELVKDQKNIIVRTRDFILSADKIARMYDIPRSMVTIVRDGNMNDLAEQTDYAPRSSSLLTHVGSASSFLSGVLVSERLLSVSRMSAVIGKVALGVGAVLAALLAVLGTLGTTSLSSVLLFQFIWLAIQAAAILVRRAI